MKNENIDDTNNYISIGFCSDKVHITYDSNGLIKKNPYLNKTNKWITGDTVGIGFIHINPKLIKFFFTHNGQLLFTFNNIINTILNNKIIPIIQFNHSHHIKLNFSNDIFVYDIKNLINCNLTLSSNNIFMENYDINYFNNINETLMYNSESNNNNDQFNNFLQTILNTNVNSTQLTPLSFLHTSQNINSLNISNLSTFSTNNIFNSLVNSTLIFLQ